MVQVLLYVRWFGEMSVHMHMFMCTGGWFHQWCCPDVVLPAIHAYCCLGYRICSSCCCYEDVAALCIAAAAAAAMYLAFTPIILLFLLYCRLVSSLVVSQEQQVQLMQLPHR